MRGDARTYIYMRARGNKGGNKGDMTGQIISGGLEQPGRRIRGVAALGEQGNGGFLFLGVLGRMN